MRQIELTVRGMDLDYKRADLLARDIVQQIDTNPTVIAWRDRPQQRMSPVIEGADLEYRWRDYGESHGGDVLVSVNGDYDFVFAESREYEEVTPSPYLSVHDNEGHEYFCLPEHLRKKGVPSAEECTRLDEPTATSSLHEG